MREIWRGVRLLYQGQKWAAGHRREWRLGMVPALITLVGYVAALAALLVWTDDMVAWATPFADDWASPWAGVFRGLLDAVVVGGGLLLAVVSFTAVTLLVGQPFYETIAARVDRAEGGPDEAPEPGLWRELWIGARDSVRVLVRVAAFGVVLFALGFVPVVGQTVVPAVGFCVSGFFLTLELSAVAMQRRDVPLRERIRVLRSRLPLVLGFGVPLVVTFLVPFVAVLLMPGAVAGATLLVREVLPADPGPYPHADPYPYPHPHPGTPPPGGPDPTGPPGS
jgi:CysZ protein